MSNRSTRKAKMQVDLKRVVVTDKKEADLIKQELKEKAWRDNEAKRLIKVMREEQHRRDSAPWQAQEETETGWRPPRSLADFQALMNAAHPDWPLAARRWEAKKMMQRHPLIEKAFLAGLDKGRVLREQAEYDHGWWWEELRALEPSERGYVIEQVRRIIMPIKRTNRA